MKVLLPRSDPPARLSRNAARSRESEGEMERSDLVDARQMPIRQQCRAHSELCGVDPARAHPPGTRSRSEGVSPDEELMVRVGRDDLQALGELFDRRRPRLFAFLLRLVGDRTAAEDLVQEVFWRVWEHRASYDARRSSSTWLYTIARRVAWNELKSGSHRTARFSELSEAEQQRVEAGEPGQSADLPEERAVAAAQRAQVQAALRALPPEQRAGILLREYEGMSHREIGEVLGCSEGAARVLVHRARRALRALLSPLLESEE